MTRTLRDDLGHEVALPTTPVCRVVSLVPSLTEAVAATAPEALVGATDWCTHPADLDVTRVRGTKNPDRAAIADLRPDLVVANKEENRELDVQRMRADGIQVWVTDIETVPQALASMRRLFVEACGWSEPEWLVEADRLWAGPVPGAHRRVVVPIWRDPWMVVGHPTFTADLLARVGCEVTTAGEPGRYPHVDVDRLDASGADLVLLPDEPYVFTADDGPEAFARTATRLVNGRLLTWYGPSLVEARAALTGL
ncbi:ABC transporter substrate-binding protein [Knoellia flava TL1]|uniref:ABC transporter substrate-binding protein n=2 Tax=Knoellia flava TaxID=913969 RepID=A0A8H9FUA1_9MICO|nr:helical backbone metal receptor [Knoellia flava]KGN33456.1 ABC transporter substrate-binding protein [Knoellia flava TL1]GGB74145.1 ABC transporter substrate-binding protein [Knoellia flava]